MGASHGIHRVDAAGAAPPELIAPVGFGTIGHTAIDGSGEVLYVKMAAGVPRMFRHSLAGRSPDSALNPGVIAVRPQASPDGRWLAYLAPLAGSAEVHVRSTDPARTEGWRGASAADLGSSLHWSRPV